MNSNNILISLNAGARLRVLRANLDTLKYDELCNDAGLDPAELAPGNLVLPVLHVDITNPVETQVVSAGCPDVTLKFRVQRPIRGELLPPRTVCVFIKNGEVVLCFTSWQGDVPYSGRILEIDVEPIFDNPLREKSLVDVADYQETQPATEAEI